MSCKFPSALTLPLMFLEWKTEINLPKLPYNYICPRFQSSGSHTFFPHGWTKSAKPAAAHLGMHMPTLPTLTDHFPFAHFRWVPLSKICCAIWCLRKGRGRFSARLGPSLGVKRSWWDGSVQFAHEPCLCVLLPYSYCAFCDRPLTLWNMLTKEVTCVSPHISTLCSGLLICVCQAFQQ